MKLFACFLVGTALLAETQTARPWTDVASLSYVATDGNSEGRATGFANDTSYRWAQSTLVVKAGAIRVSSTSVTRSAVGTTLGNAVITETRTTRTTAESLFLNGRYDYRLKDLDRWYWFAGVGWERNRPAGLEARQTATGGFGRIWLASARTKFRTDLGGGFTHETPLAPPVGFRHNFGTVNLSSKFSQKVGVAAEFIAELNLVESLSDHQDFLGTLRQGLTVNLNRTLALKVGYDLAFRNQPNLLGFDAYTPDPVPVNLGKVYVPAKRLDTVFTTSFVITF